MNSPLPFFSQSLGGYEHADGRMVLAPERLKVNAIIQATLRDGTGKTNLVDMQ